MGLVEEAVFQTEEQSMACILLASVFSSEQASQGHLQSQFALCVDQNFYLCVWTYICQRRR